MAEDKETRSPEIYLTPKQLSERYGGRVPVELLEKWRSGRGAPVPPDAERSSR